MSVCLYMCNAFDEWNNIIIMIVSTDVPALLVVGGLGT